MKRARVLTPWTGDGLTTQSARRPKLLVDFPTLVSCMDATGQPATNIVPDPNLFVVEITCSDAVMTAIESSAEYGDGVLWSEDI